MESRERNCWDDLDDVLAAGLSRVLLYGPPGTGKTFAALHHGVDTVAERLVCTEDLTSGEITGTWMPSAEGFTWREGPALRAWHSDGGCGGRLVLDEVDRAAGDALATILAVTDSPASSRWRHPETLAWLRPGPNFSVVMTSNVEDVLDLPPSLLDRFPVRIHVDRPPVNAVTSLSADLRASALAGSLGPAERRVSLRAFYAFDDLRRCHGDARAAQLVFGDAAPAVLDALRVAAVA